MLPGKALINTFSEMRSYVTAVLTVFPKRVFRTMLTLLDRVLRALPRNRAECIITSSSRKGDSFAECVPFMCVITCM